MFSWGRKGRAKANAVQEAALSEILRAWSVDNADVAPTKAGFDWLPGSHMVRVRISEDERKSQPPRYRISITTDFIRSVPVHDPAFVRKAGVFAGSLCPTYSPVFPPSEVVKKYFDGQPIDMQLFGSAYVDETTAPWLVGFLARVSIIQPSFAERVSEPMRDEFGVGVPAFAAAARRADPHGVLQIDHVLRAAGAGASRWTDSDEFEEFAEIHAKNDMCFGFGRANGLTLETPFGSDSALILFKADETYPPLGNGLLVETVIRLPETHEKIADMAAWLNYLESVQWTDLPQIGRWHPYESSQDQTFLAHSCFVPNEFFARGLVQNYGLWAIARAQWARGILLPDTKNLTMREILETRHGLQRN
jgi:hypothetical protein